MAPALGMRPVDVKISPADGLVVVTFEIGVEQLLECLHAQEAADHVFAVAHVDDGRFLFLVLVRDLANDLFDDVSMVMMPAVPPYSSTTTAT